MIEITRAEMEDLRAWFQQTKADAQTGSVKVDALLKRFDPAPAARVRFDSPVGTAEERSSAKLWPGAWWDASPFGKVYTSSTGVQAIHTGADLNAPEDVNAPVYAPADGIVRFAGTVNGWQLQMVVIEHLLENRTRVWSRNAHLIGLVVAGGDAVQRGDLLGYIGDYSPVGAKGNHDHYDIARKNLSETPGDWPGMDGARVVRDYLDPLAFTRDRHG